MNKLIIYFALINCLCVQFALSQSVTWEEADKNEIVLVLEKINNWFLKTKSYQLNITHQSYESYETQTVYDQSHGYFIKSDNNYHSFLMGIRTIQNEEYKVIVDSVNRIIRVENSDKWLQTPFSSQEILTSINGCKNILVKRNGEETTYKLIFPENSSVNYYEITLKNDKLIKIEMYLFREAIKEGSAFETETITPRVSIAFSNYYEQAIFTEEAFSIAKYITINSDKKISLIEKYMDFQLMDGRINY